MKRCYDSGAAKRKKHEHALNELSNQRNLLDGFRPISHRHSVGLSMVNHVNV